MTESAAAAGGAHHSLTRGAATIAYCHTPAGPAGQGLPGVMFLGGFMSDMTGGKATALERWAVAQGLSFTRFDYQGHGASSGRFADGTIGLWADDALAVLDQVTSGPQILVGSSMGGWMMLLTALRRPERVAGLVGIAPAPDFTEELMWDIFDEGVRRQILEDGVWNRPSDYGPEPQPITRALIEDGRSHLLLRNPGGGPSGASIAFDGPVRLLHGQRDPDVPWQLSLRIAEALTGDDVSVTLVKDGDHRLSRPQDLDLLCRTVGALVHQSAGVTGKA
ncbi:alpha/beta hydrolase family protein [Azospirillum picis]|uniref:Pimeloyl-ACP methyl ester carboxylesterase n=1 Tax=Azospirillum picis TaxID=488438 RepID=A0ABU0MSF3_9PROT|nr:alpha/beta hydrolase [Azospirillum picis]MBP2301946.1 pimeloyl-ACP methyl ester carboxylesterase [Azospirillum picis]MDQ0536395.1 pimeloyl-ACP methyl ester carboxylesterase [Azospirillum picis]